MAVWERSNFFLLLSSTIFQFELSFVTDVRPTIISGLKNLRVLKTTKSSFVDFVDDEYRSLPDMEDRLFRYVSNGFFSNIFFWIIALYSFVLWYFYRIKDFRVIFHIFQTSWLKTSFFLLKYTYLKIHFVFLQ